MIRIKVGSVVFPTPSLAKQEPNNLRNAHQVGVY